MATLTKTFKENNPSTSYASTWTVSATASNITVSGSTFTLPKPTIKAKYVYSGKTKGRVILVFSYYLGNDRLCQGQFIKEGSDPSGHLTSMASGTTYTIANDVWAVDNNATSYLFNSNNANSKTVNINLSSELVYLVSGVDSHGNTNSHSTSGRTSWGNILTVTLNAPPTFTATGSLSGSYVGASTYTATLSSCSAKYGGTIKSTKLTIGSQSVTGSGNGTLTITPNTAGTFTPTVTVTDSRGQTTTKSLSAITIKANVCDIKSLATQRIDSTSFAVSDEGTNAVIKLGISYTAFSGNYLNKPTVKLNGTTTSNVTWYESWSSTSGFTNPITWTNYAPSSTMTLYGKVTNELSQIYSYLISVTVSSTTGRSSTKSVTLSQAFFLLAGLAGGHGLGIGMKPPYDGLYVNMYSKFYDGVFIDDTLRVTDTTRFDSDATRIGGDGSAPAIVAKRSDTNTSVAVMVGTGGVNHGLYSKSKDKWILYHNGTNVCIPNDLTVSGTVNNRDMSKLLTRSEITTVSHTLADYSSSPISVSANSDSGAQTATITNSGYYPYGIVGWNVTGTNRAYQNLYECLFTARASGSGTITFRFRNNASAAVNIGLVVHVLWIKVL